MAFNGGFIGSNGNFYGIWLAWLVVYLPTPLKNDGRIVSWDDFPFPTEWKNPSIHVPTKNQSESDVRSNSVFNTCFV